MSRKYIKKKEKSKKTLKSNKNNSYFIDNVKKVYILKFKLLKKQPF
jgi:hypothetical protein